MHRMELTDLPGGRQAKSRVRRREGQNGCPESSSLEVNRVSNGRTKSGSPSEQDTRCAILRWLEPCQDADSKVWEGAS